MKRPLPQVILFLLMFSQSGFAQQAREVFNPQVPIVWLGLDFSQVRFIGDYAEFRTIDAAKKLIIALNDLMLSEPEKYDVGKMLGKQKVEQRLDVTMVHNNGLDISALMADSLGSHSHLKEQDIQKIIDDYDFKGSTGIGLMFNVESFNKPLGEGLIWVTFMNMNTKEILFTERLGEDPSGFGIRNYWAGSVYHVMARVRKKELKAWRVKYVNK
ncbi:hypothetical protein BH10BAC4_BH10BAC4_08890 [soil metagenome]